ncbi:MAG TPA: glutamate-1-semialdehyde 2,1-aminomutase [Acidobacteriaceae bacterium]|nr:glutamate-1-semialdehyde 2,1-aminomutase [Acidobacteriaceae bacterium]
MIDNDCDILEVQSSPSMIDFSRSRALQPMAHRLIPGGSHTYAKGDDQYPEIAPGFIARGKGCHVWDLDGNEFIEYGMGLRAVALGHAFDSVVESAHRQMRLGLNFNRPSPLEVELAESMLSLVDGAHMVKFAKNGSDVTTAAVKLARAYTGRDFVAICGDQPFFSVDDWFIGSTPMHAGIPDSVINMTKKFAYNDLTSLRDLFDEHPARIACVVMEAEATTPPVPGYLRAVKDLCEQRGAVLVFDEMITGFRWHLGGAQKYHDVIPHLSTFGKAMGNGFAIAALVGTREIMQLGGLDHDQKRVFLLSTTHGAETHALAASLETIRIFREQGVVEYLWRQGERLRAGVNRVIAQHGIAKYFELAGRSCNLLYRTKDDTGAPSQNLRTLFLQELIRGGILAPSFVVSFSHSDEDIDRTIDVVDRALAVYSKALEDGVQKYLVGRPVKPVNREYV